MKIRQILATILSALVKIAVVLWVANFIYTKTMSAYDFGYRVFTEEPISPSPGRDVQFSYTEGKSYMDIAKTMEEKGLVRDHNLAYIQILVSEGRKEMKPGAYTLNTSMTVEDMVTTMTQNDEYDEEEE